MQTRTGLSLKFDVPIRSPTLPGPVHCEQFFPKSQPTEFRNCGERPARDPMSN